MKISNQHSGAVLRYKIGFMRNGVKFFRDGWRNNLILDTGLDAVGNNRWCDMFNYCLFGDQVSPDPVERNSGSTTFTTVGTACTASAAFFVAQDVGRLIKFDDTDGQERYITNFTDSTHVTLGVAPSPVITAKTATVWYVNQTALQSLNQVTATCDQSGGSNGTTFAANVATNKRTFVGTAMVANTTLTEVGFNYNGGNANIFDRDIIPGGIALLIGDIPLCICELIVTFNHTVPLAVGNVGTGFDSSGTTQLTGLYIAATSMSTVNAGGATVSPGFNIAYGPLDPGDPDSIHLATATFSIPVFNNVYNGTVTSVAPDSRSSAYNGAGTFSRDTTCGYGLTIGNGIIYGFANQSAADLWMLLLTTPFTKLSSQTLSIVTRKTWNRILTN